MRIEPCPCCGKAPVIEELHERPKGIRRRMCHCPNLCSVIPCVHKKYYQFAFIYVGNGDSNAILRNWNSGVRYYKKHGWMSYGSYTKFAWTDDPQVQNFDW